MTTKPAFPALGVPMSPAWVHGSPHVEDLALPESLKAATSPPPRLSSGGCRLRQLARAGGANYHFVTTGSCYALTFREDHMERRSFLKCIFAGVGAATIAFASPSRALTRVAPIEPVDEATPCITFMRF
jgi:hypothetical protein